MQDNDNISEFAPVEQQLTRTQMTPAQIAVLRLVRILEKDPQIAPDMRIAFRDEMMLLPNIRFMNMETLAAALVLIQRAGGNPSPDFFRQNIDSFMARFGEAPQGVDREAYRRAHRENILRYMFTILANRQ